MNQDVGEPCPPVNPCLLELVIDENVVTGNLEVTVIGNSGIPSLSWEIIQGSPQVTLLPGGTGISVSGTNFNLNVSVEDESGCSVTKSLNNN